MNKRAFLILFILAFVFVGCSEKKKNIPQENCVNVVDALGRDVSVPKNPERVATLLGSFSEIWRLAGGEVVATSEDAFEDFGIDPEGIVNIGGAHSPNLELIFSSSPDLVLASAVTASNVELLDTLERSGITVAYFDVVNFESYLAMLDVCTEITGRRELYEKNGLNLKDEIELLKTECANLGEKEKKVLLLRASSGGAKAKGSHGTVLGEMLSDLGCVNIADSETSLLENLSVEAVIRENPYRIFAVTMGSDTEKAERVLIEMLEDDPAWAGLDAVKENRVHVMDKRLFNLKPCDKWASAYEILVTILCEK